MPTLFTYQLNLLSLIDYIPTLHSLVELLTG